MISLIFGAGASFGSEMEGATPPLGNHLFEELEKLNGYFSKLPEEVKSEFRVNGFEQGMLGIPNDSSIINPLQKELAMYLSSFKPSIDNAYVRLFRMLGDALKKIHIITLNYDLMIEQSLGIVGFRIVRYGLSNEEVSLLKVHGSSNFIPDTRGNFFGDMVAVNCGTFIETGRVSVLNNHDEIQAWCNSSQSKSLSPVMCMYNKEKKLVINPKTFEELKGQFNQAITLSETIVIAGVKYVPHDHHIWDDVLSSKANVIIIDTQPDEVLINEFKLRNTIVTVIRSSFYDCIPRLSGLIRKSLRENKLKQL